MEVALNLQIASSDAPVFTILNLPIRSMAGLSVFYCLLQFLMCLLFLLEVLTSFIGFGFRCFAFQAVVNGFFFSLNDFSVNLCFSLLSLVICEAVCV